MFICPCSPLVGKHRRSPPDTQPSPLVLIDAERKPYSRGVWSPFRGQRRGDLLRTFSAGWQCRGADFRVVVPVAELKTCNDGADLAYGLRAPEEGPGDPCRSGMPRQDQGSNRQYHSLGGDDVEGRQGQKDPDWGHEKDAGEESGKGRLRGGRCCCHLGGQEVGKPKEGV